MGEQKLPIQENRMPVIKRKDVPQFVREFNKNKISKEIIEASDQAGELFSKRKNRVLSR